MGKLDEADMLLVGRSLVLDGQFDHPLTCVGTAGAGPHRDDPRRHAPGRQLAGRSGLLGVLLRRLGRAHRKLSGWAGSIIMASGAAGVYPPLEPVAAWAQANRLQHIVDEAATGAGGKFAVAWPSRCRRGAVLDDAARRMGEMRGGLPGIHQLYLQAPSNLLRGQIAARRRTADAGDRAHRRTRRCGISRSCRTNEMYDARAVSPRVAVDLYGSLLADPTPADWVCQSARCDGRAANAARCGVRPLVSRGAGAQGCAAGAGNRRAGQAAAVFGDAAVRRPAACALHDSRSAGYRVVAIAVLAAATNSRRHCPPINHSRRPVSRMYDQLRGGPVLATDAAETKALAALYKRLGQEREPAATDAGQAGRAARAVVDGVPTAAHDRRAAGIARRRRSAGRVSHRGRQPVRLLGHKSGRPHLAIARRAATAEWHQPVSSSDRQLRAQSPNVARRAGQRRDGETAAKDTFKSVRGDARLEICENGKSSSSCPTTCCGICRSKRLYPRG